MKRLLQYNKGIVDHGFDYLQCPFITFPLKHNQTKCLSYFTLYESLYEIDLSFASLVCNGGYLGSPPFAPLRGQYLHPHMRCLIYPFFIPLKDSYP